MGWTVGDSGTILAYTDYDAPTITINGADSAWHDAAVELTLTAAVDSSLSLSRMQYRTDDDSTWTNVSGRGNERTLTISDEGKTSVSVRITDSGGQRARDSAPVRIDTVKPTSKAKALTLKAAKAKKGRKVTIKVTVKDAKPTCGSATVVTTITTKSGSKLGRTTTKNVATNATRSVSVKLSAKLKKGTYYIRTRATDRAGNVQASAGKVKLTVK